MPTETSKNNLFKENVKLLNILITGNTFIDALYVVLDKIQKNINPKKEAEAFIQSKN